MKTTIKPLEFLLNSKALEHWNIKTLNVRTYWYDVHILPVCGPQGDMIYHFYMVIISLCIQD